jgi:hypothetical protein
MNTDKIICFLVLILTFISSSIIYAQEKTELDTSKIIGRWVLNSKDLNVEQDTLEYVPYNSPLTADLQPLLKYGGISFRKNGIFLQHHWKKCGNDNSPNFSESGWTIVNDKNKTILIIESNKKIEYYIYSLSSDKLVLIVKK